MSISIYDFQKFEIIRLEHWSNQKYSIQVLLKIFNFNILIHTATTQTLLGQVHTLKKTKQIEISK